MYDFQYFNETKLVYSARGISSWELAHQLDTQTETGYGGNARKVFFSFFKSYSFQMFLYREKHGRSLS